MSASPPPADLDRQLLELLVETNEQRRRVGQTLYHLYRTLVFWLPKQRSFLDVTRAWSASGAAVFDALATTLGDLGPWKISTGPSRRQRAHRSDQSEGNRAASSGSNRTLSASQSPRVFTG